MQWSTQICFEIHGFPFTLQTNIYGSKRFDYHESHSSKFAFVPPQIISFIHTLLSCINIILLLLSMVEYLFITID